MRRTVDGVITFFNEYAQKFFGYDRRQILGRDVVGTIVPATDTSGRDLAAMVADISLHPDEYATNENENMRRNGERVWIAWTNKAIRDEEGNVTEILCVGNDITERKRLEHKLRQLQKVEMIGQLASGVAHDFNNVLTAIQGFGGLAHEDLPDNSPVRQRIEEVLKAANRAALLVRQLMALNRRQALQSEVLDLGSVVKNLEKMLHRVIREDITLKIIRGPGVSLVEADPGQIEQVVMNLAVNARDAMPNGGELTIEIENVEVSGNCRFHPDEIAPGRYSLLTVTDSGVGMDDHTRSQMFEPFFTTKDSEKGTGMGLATVYGIVKRHKGWIDVETSPGTGTALRLYLPCVDAKHTIDEDVKSEETPHGSGTLLVVEDDEHVLKATTTFLRSRGYEVLAAADGREALTIARLHPEEIALLITDVVMPGYNGFQVARKIKRLRPDIRVLFISGYREGEVLDGCKLSHDSGLIPKPFTVTGLAKKVHRMLQNRKSSEKWKPSGPGEMKHERESSFP